MLRRIEEGTTTASDVRLLVALVGAAFAVGVLIGVAAALL